MGSTASGGSCNFAVKCVGATISSTRSFGVGYRTVNVSILASQPHSLNFERIHSAFSLSYADPTWCGRALSRRMYSRWLSGLGMARNFASHSRSVAELARVKPCSGSSSAPVETRPNKKTNNIPVIAMRRIAAPDFRTLAAIPASYGREAYCKEIARPSPAIPRNQQDRSDISGLLGIDFAHQHQAALRKREVEQRRRRREREADADLIHEQKRRERPKFIQRNHKGK